MGKAIGIDFGTSNTVVSYLNKKNDLRQLRFNGNELIPTVLFYKTKDDYVTGLQARERGKIQAGAMVDRFKTKLSDRDFRFDVYPENGKMFRLAPRLAVRLFLNRIAADTEAKLIREFGADEGLIDRMVITVPAKFNPEEKAAIRKAAAAAIGRDDPSCIRLAPEPAAAAIASMHDGECRNSETILVYDFGGGTFDISLIKKERGVFRQITDGGDKHLGGNDITDKLTARLLDLVNEEYGTEFPLDENDFDEDCGISLLDYRRNIQNLRDAANMAKEDLSSQDEVDISVNVIINGDHNELFVAEISRRELEDLIRPEISRTVRLVQNLLEEPKAKAAGPVESIVLAGGSSRIPLVRQLLKENLSDIPISTNDNVSTLISRGAALLAQKIEDVETVTESATTSRLGVSATEGVSFNIFQMIIPENMPLPAEASRDFRLNRDGQEALDICYYEHDVKNYPNAISISDDGMQEVDRLHMDLPSGLKAANTVITITFHVRKDGTLDLKAVIRDNEGNTLDSRNHSVTRASDLE